MKKQLSKKLSAFIVTAMMFSASATAQIVNTNANPDHVISGGSSASRTNIGDRKSSKTISDLNNRPKNNISNENESLREIPDALDKFILKSMKNHHIPGLSASIIKNGKIAWTKGYGYANIEKNIPFTPNTVHAELASISKTVCATALLKLYEQGAFQLDDPINNYLPFPVTNPYFPNVPITFHMLLNHRSSINDFNLAYSPYLALGTSGSLSDFLQSILVPGGAFYADSTSYYNYEPGSQYNYSNYGFALIGYLVEHISGMPFDQYCNQNIFQPLCMDNTGWHFSDIDTNAVSHPYYYDAQSNSWIDYGLYEYGDYPDGLLKTSAINLSKFMLMLMNYGIVDGVRILDSTTVARMTTKEYEIYPNVFTGLCLFNLGDYGGYQIWGHDGGDLGITTEMWFNQTNSTGIIMLTNGEDITASGCTTPDDIMCRLLHIADTISTISSPNLNCSYLEFPCTHSNTFWKNHSELWALNSVPMKLGTTNFYSEKKVLNFLKKPINGNASIVLAKQLIAAKLNVAQGSETTPIYSVINAANDLIGNRNLPINPGVSFFSSEGLHMLYLAGQLSAYNHSVLNTQPCNANGNRDEGEQEDLYESLSEHDVTISPNPISNSTTISFSLAQSENVSLKIFDVNGRLIETLTAQVFEEGEHSIEWNAEKVNAGVYFLKVQTAEYSRTEKLIVTK